MSWIRLDDALFQDDWYNELSDPSKLAWIHLLLFANRNRGTFRRSSPKLLARNLSLSENSVSEMMKSALEAGKILQPDPETYLIANHRKYQPDPTNSERQERFRKKDSNGYVTDDNGDPRYVTDVTATVTSTSTDTSKKENQVKEKSPVSATNTNSAIDIATNDFTIKYNRLTEKHPALRKVRIPLAPGLRKKLATRLKEPEFDTNKVLTALHNSKFHHGDNDKNWAASFSWIVKNPENYLLILSAATAAKAQTQQTENYAPPKPCPDCGKPVGDTSCKYCGWTNPKYLKKS